MKMMPNTNTAINWLKGLFLPSLMVANWLSGSQWQNCQAQTVQSSLAARPVRPAIVSSATNVSQVTKRRADHHLRRENAA
jgi:hypothetical protein